MTGPAEGLAANNFWRADWLPGVLLAALLAVLAGVIQNQTGIPAILAALGLGLLASPLGQTAWLAPGVGVASRTVLRLGVGLLGVGISVSAIGTLGIGAVLVALVVVVATLATGYGLARLLRLPPAHAWIAAGAVAICGASAALAIAAIFPASKQRDFQAASTVAIVTLIGSVAMVAYPFLAAGLGFDESLSGVFLGASLHEVAQAIAGGFSVSELAGDSATLTKLVRVALLAPVVIGLSLMMRRGAAASADSRLPPLLPWFLVLFVMLAVLANLGLIPARLIEHASSASRWMLVAAIAALGMKVSPREVLASGLTPLLAIGLTTLACAAFALIGVEALMLLHREF